jgi:hypothetical protein
MPELIRRWLVETLKQKGMPVNVIEPSVEWLSVAREGR